jgi:DNA-binding transcriptional ArsR family regulator
MEAALSYVLAGTRGGPNRVRILTAIDDRPRNANQLADRLDLDYTTVRHHLDVLRDHGVVERTGDGYGTVYYPTDGTRRHWDLVEEIAERLAI